MLDPYLLQIATERCYSAAGLILEDLYTCTPLTQHMHKMTLIAYTADKLWISTRPHCAVTQHACRCSSMHTFVHICQSYRTHGQILLVSRRSYQSLYGPFFNFLPLYRRFLLSLLTKWEHHNSSSRHDSPTLTLQIMAMEASSVSHKSEHTASKSCWGTWWWQNIRNVHQWCESEKISSVQSWRRVLENCRNLHSHKNFKLCVRSDLETSLGLMYVVMVNRAARNAAVLGYHPSTWLWPTNLACIFSSGPGCFNVMKTELNRGCLSVCGWGWGYMHCKLGDRIIVIHFYSN